jgi:5-methylcytosine-specific restriction enzyme A
MATTILDTSASLPSSSHWFEEELLGADVADTKKLAAIEGALIRRLTVHRHRESALRLAKLEAARKADPDGRLVCQVPGCGFDFDFEAKYGPIGVGYAEVHHLTPLASFSEESTTTLHDLAVVCSNCHRMIHRGGDCRDIETLLGGAGDA